MVGAGWNPWAALRALDQVRLAFSRLAGADGHLYVEGTNVVIELDERLERDERNAVLAHELVHLERGGGAGYPGAPRTWAAVVARDEAAVDREVARRLIPFAALVELAERAASIGEPLTEAAIAEEFDVPAWVVEALRRDVG